MSDSRWSLHTLAWNDPRYFFDLLSSIEQQQGTRAQMVLIEHAHTGAVTSKEVDHTRCTVLRNAQDKGFAASHAQAIQFSLSHRPPEELARRYVAITHPDCLFAPDCLLKAEQTFQKQPEVQVILPRILRAQSEFSDKGDERQVHFTEEQEVGGMFPCVFVRASFLSQVQFKFLSEQKAMSNFLKQSVRLGQKPMLLAEAVVWHHAHHLPESSFFAKVRGLFGI
jgi:hypothetical protein